MRAGVDAELHIVGDGPLKDEITAHIRETGVGERIKLIGGLPQAAVINEFKTTDILILPSVTAANGDKEGIPIVLMEAQAMGLPVISTRHSGIPELVTDGKSGYLVAEKDAQSLANRMSELATKPDLRKRMGKEGRKKVVAIFSHQEEMDRLEKLFGKLMAGRTLISEISPDVRGLVEHRIHEMGVQLIEYRGDQIRRVDQQITRSDERLKKFDDILRALGDVNTKELLIRQKDEQVRQKDEQVREKDEQLRRKDEDLSHQQDQARNLSEQLRNKDVINGQIQKAILENEAQLKTLQNTILDRDARLKKVEAESVVKDISIAEYGRNLQKQTGRINELEKTLSNAETTATGLRQLIAAKELHLTERERHIQEKDAQIQAVQTTLKSLKAHVADLQIEIRTKSEDILSKTNDIQGLTQDVAQLGESLNYILSSFPYKVYKVTLKPIVSLFKR